MKNRILWAKNTEDKIFYLVKGNQWTDDRSKAGMFTFRGVQRLLTMHVKECLGAPDPNGDFQIYLMGERVVDI